MADGLTTLPLTLEQWRVVRDTLQSLWDWWRDATYVAVPTKAGTRLAPSRSRGGFEPSEQPWQDARVLAGTARGILGLFQRQKISTSYAEMKRRAERWSGRARRVGWTAAVLLAACRSGSPSAAEASASYRPWTEAERLECSEKASASLQVLQAAVADAPRACAADDDCGIYVGLPKCVYGCGLTAAVSDGSSIDAAIAEVDAAYCPAVCVPIPPPCPGESGFEAPRAACVAGACTLDTHETVVREAFQDTVYPLLRSNCQGCHSSEAQAQAPLIADPDVSQAFHATAHYFSWRGEGDRFWIDAPQTSRLVSILSTEQHDCWSECTTDAETLLQAVQAWSDEQERR